MTEVIHDELVEKFVNDCVNFEQEESPEILFHYTSADVAEKIITGKSLWMTHAFHMNDADEFSHGMNLFKEGLNLLEKEGVEKEWLDRIRAFFDQEIRNPLAIPFIFSSTREPDQERQWQDYGDNGRGVSIGIKSGVLTKLSGNLGGPVVVIYEEVRKTQIVRKVVDEFIKLAKTLIRKLDNPNYVREFALAYFRVAYLQSMRFKKTCWQHEKEWRYFMIAKWDHAKIFSRTRETKEVKYFHQDLPVLKELLTEIITGPIANGEAAALLDSLKTKADLAFDIRSSMFQPQEAPA